MANMKNIEGQRFGRLVALERYGVTETRYVLWLCKCDCGNEVAIRGDHLRKGRRVSCGCKWKKDNGDGRTKHPLYGVWCGIKRRCKDKRRKDYKNYGGRGIKVCKEWIEDPFSFYNWAENNGYKEGLTIDRIDVDGNYCPGNCRWVTRKENCRNTRRPKKYIEYKGTIKTLGEWADELGISYDTLLGRLREGWSVERAFEFPRRFYNTKLKKDLLLIENLHKFSRLLQK